MARSGAGWRHVVCGCGFGGDRSSARCRRGVLALLMRRVRCGFGWDESAPAWCGVGVDGVAVAVDDDVVVEPAQEGEVVGVVRSAVDSSSDVVGLEAVAAGATVGSSHAGVPLMNQPAYPRWLRMCAMSDGEESAVSCLGVDV
jgi:hypothetical protein